MKDFRVLGDQSRYISRRSRRTWRLIMIALVCVGVGLIGFMSTPYLQGTEADEPELQREVGSDLRLSNQGQGMEDLEPVEDVRGGGGGQDGFPQLNQDQIAEKSPPQIQFIEPFSGDEKSLEYVTHTVESGESLWSIGNTYDRDVTSIASANFERLKSYRSLPVGIELRIPNRDGILHEIERGESLWTLQSTYEIPIESIREFNQLESDSLQSGQEVFVPGAEPQHPHRYSWLLGESRGFRWPVRPDQRRLSSRYGNRYHPIYERKIFHKGIDIAATHGTRVHAAEHGEVVKATRMGGYGYVVDIQHPNDYTTRYAHLASFNVKPGEDIKKGEVIGKIGDSGLATGANLHFEIRENHRDPVNPLNHLD